MKKFLGMKMFQKMKKMYTIRKTEMDDVPQLEKIFAVARKKMRATGNPKQWEENYPSIELITKDIQLGRSYAVEYRREKDEGNGYEKEKDKTVVGTFVMLTEPDPSYTKIDGAWLNDKPYATIHRLASLEGYHGVFAAVLDYVSAQYDDVRADTHPDNLPMRHLLQKNGFQYCGNILLAERVPQNLQPKDEKIQADNPLFRMAYHRSK